MMNAINWNQEILIDESVEKVNYHEYSPHTGTDLNAQFSDIRIEIQNQDQFLLPSESYLYIEAELSYGEPYKYEEDIGLINNAIMYLFDRVSYRLSDREIEGYSYPGVATTMKGLLTYPKDYNDGSQFIWKLDQGKTMNNKGFLSRRKFYWDRTNTGKFSVILPLDHIFGFCEDYRKVMYGLKHVLTLRRNHNNDAIIKSAEQGEIDGVAKDKVTDGRIDIKRLSWHMPHILLSDEAELSLYSDVQNKKSLRMAFLNRQSERLILKGGSKELDWQLNVAAGSEKPRYIILGFHNTKENSQKQNPAIFNHLNVANAYIDLNSERYPEENLNIDFGVNNHVKPYKMAVNYYKNIYGSKPFPFTIDDFKEIYPLLVFDVSKQRERLKNSPIDIRIRASFRDAIPNECECYVYALILSDKLITLESDGNKMIVH